MTKVQDHSPLIFSTGKAQPFKGAPSDIYSQQDTRDNRDDCTSEQEWLNMAGMPLFFMK